MHQAGTHTTSYATALLTVLLSYAGVCAAVHMNMFIHTRDNTYFIIIYVYSSVESDELHEKFGFFRVDCVDITQTTVDDTTGE